MPLDVPLTRNWVAQPGSQQFFLSCPVFEVLFEGTRGNGKTDALLMDFAQHVGCGFGEHWRGIIFRQTYKQLGDVVAKSHRWFRTLFPGAKFIQGEFFGWKFPDGEVLLLRHMRTIADYDNYHGHEYPWIGWEELTNWPNGDCYEAMKSCCRSSLPHMPRKYRSTCNPFGVGHNWVKAYFIDPAPRGKIIGDAPPQRVCIHGDIRENRVLLDADPEYVAKLEAIRSKPKRLAWRYGDWNIASGGMFDDVWDADTHLIAPFAVPVQWYVDRAFDWGSSKPFSVGWYAESDGAPVRLCDGRQRSFPRGTLFRIGEWYGWNGEPNGGSQLLATRIADGILEHERRMGIDDQCDPGPADSSIWDEVNGNCIARDMASHGVDFVPANKGPGSRKNGWELIRIRLANADTQEKVGEYPAFYVFDRTLLPMHTLIDARLRALGECEQFKRTFPYLPRDPLDMDDADTEAEDHIADEVRYRVLASAVGLVSQYTSSDVAKRRKAA